MAVETASLNNALVMRDTKLTWRLHDAFGPNVMKWIEDFVYLNTDDTTGDPTAYTMTVIEVGAGDSTAVVSAGAPGQLLMTAAANENDGVQLQLKNGEAFKFDAAFPCYFGIKWQAGDVDQSDFLAGLCIQDTTLLGGLSDGIYFRSLDAAATVQFVLEKDSTETSAGSVATMTDATYVTLEFYYDGSTVKTYVDGVEATSTADSDTNFPDDEDLAPSIAFLTGEAVANTLTVEWARAIQIRN
jgi:hypothetical protein